jgi:hypothetical protein
MEVIKEGILVTGSATGAYQSFQLLGHACCLAAGSEGEWHQTMHLPTAVSPALRFFSCSPIPKRLRWSYTTEEKSIIGTIAKL